MAVLEFEVAGKPQVFCDLVATKMFDARVWSLMPGYKVVAAVRAESCIIPLLDMVPAGGLKNALESATIHLRDIIALRVQCRVPIDSRDAFLEMLRGAYGGQVAHERLAKILHSHRQIIYPLFEHSFLSNSQKANATRRRPGPRPPRPRDQRRREERKRWEEPVALFADTDHAASLTDAEHAASLTDAEHAASLTDAEASPTGQPAASRAVPPSAAEQQSEPAAQPSEPAAQSSEPSAQPSEPATPPAAQVAEQEKS